MKQKNILLCAATIGIVYCLAFQPKNDHPANEIVAIDQTAVIVKATTAFLSLLSTAQRDSILFDFIPQKAATVARFQLKNGSGGSPGNRPGPPPGDSSGRNGDRQGGPPNGGRGG